MINSIKSGKTRCNFSRQREKLKLKNNYYEIFSETTSIKVQSQHWGGNRKSSMELISVAYFTNTENLGSKETKYELHSYISDDNEEDSCD